MISTPNPTSCDDKAYSVATTPVSTVSPVSLASPIALNSPVFSPFPAFEIIPTRIFVGGLPLAVTEETLGALFEQHGHVRDVKIIRTIEGSSKGYGFVTFGSIDDANKVRNLSPEDLTISGRRLNIGQAMRRTVGVYMPYHYGWIPSSPYSYPNHSYVMMPGTPMPTSNATTYFSSASSDASFNNSNAGCNLGSQPSCQKQLSFDEPMPEMDRSKDINSNMADVSQAH